MPKNKKDSLESVLLEIAQLKAQIRSKTETERARVKDLKKTLKSLLPTK
jgi:hypothetical protein